MEPKFSVRNVRKFGYTLRDCPLVRKFRKMLFPSLLEISENQTGIFGRMESAHDIFHLNNTSCGLPFTVSSTESQFTVTAIGVQFIFRNTVGTVLARIAFTRRLKIK